MEYPNLILAIRGSGRRQYEIAEDAHLRAPRLSEIVRRGAATQAERTRLCEVLGYPETLLFGKTPGPRPPVSTNRSARSSGGR